MQVSVWILGDQLLASHPALVAAENLTPREQIHVVLVESAARLARLPYQRKKLVLLLSAMRHYAAELRAAGYTVDCVAAEGVVAGLRQHVDRWRPARLFTMAAAEYRGRRLQQERLERLLGVPVTVVPNTQFLVGRHDPFPAPARKVVQENFYRSLRRHFDLLIDQHGNPIGGTWNFDKENRKTLPKAGIPAPLPLSFPPDEMTARVMHEVAARPQGVGTVDGFDLAVTRAQAEAARDDFLRHRLPDFGAYEDAMSRHSAVLFHSLLSPYLNLGLLDPLDLARRAETEFYAGRAPLNSVEGFIRQVIGWREFVYWQYWRLMPGLLTANAWEHRRPLPGFFWDGQTELSCLRYVVNRVLDTGYSHHIERLMIVCNFCLLAGIDPAAVNAWFLACYVDAYEWVVTPNVIGMGLNADGGQIATKPYIASAHYIDKMSDYCRACPFDAHRRTGAGACPYNVLYWNFLVEHEATLRANPRLGPAVLGLARITQDERAEIQRQARELLRSSGIDE
jgi:deoxyribodipyrimidine photolyase-related protein